MMEARRIEKRLSQAESMTSDETMNRERDESMKKRKHDFA